MLVSLSTFAKPAAVAVGFRGGRRPDTASEGVLSLRVWLFFVVTEVLLCLTPGPAVMFVVGCGLARGGRAALWANAGILSGNTFYFVVSAFGLGAVLVGSHEVFTVVKYLGAAYLVWLGVRTILGAGLALPAAPQAQPVAQRWRMLVRGFVLQAANPKALMFFVALLPQFIDTRRAIAPQVLILALTSVVVEFLILAGYGYGAGRAASLAREARFVTATNRTSGALLIATGTAIVLREPA
jgi:homoserine/homoserine lactone efflux protein